MAALLCWLVSLLYSQLSLPFFSSLLRFSNSSFLSVSIFFPFRLLDFSLSSCCSSCPHLFPCLTLPSALFSSQPPSGPPSPPLLLSTPPHGEACFPVLLCFSAFRHRSELPSRVLYSLFVLSWPGLASGPSLSSLAEPQPCPPQLFPCKSVWLGIEGFTSAGKKRTGEAWLAPCPESCEATNQDRSRNLSGLLLNEAFRNYCHCCYGGEGTIRVGGTAAHGLAFVLWRSQTCQRLTFSYGGDIKQTRWWETLEITCNIVNSQSIAVTSRGHTLSVTIGLGFLQEHA